MPVALPGMSNTYVPVALAGDKLLVDFARDPKRFKVSRYTQVIPVERDTGYYLYISPEEAGRIVNSDVRRFVWYDGGDAPRQHAGTQEFEFRTYRTTRYAYEFTLGYKAVEQATWDILARHAAAKAQLAMTVRTQRVADVLFDSTNYPSGNVINVNSVYGGGWNTSDLTSKRILRSLNDAADKILDGTLGMVTKDDLVLVMGTGVAKAIAQATEILELLKFQAGWDWVQGATKRTNVSYGVPEQLYGFDVVVDETRKVTTAKNASSTTIASVLPADKAVLLARPGGMEGTPGVINFAACCVFAREEMTVEQKDDPDNRRINGRVVEDFDVRLVAPVAAVLLTNVVV